MIFSFCVIKVIYNTIPASIVRFHIACGICNTRVFFYQTILVPRINPRTNKKQKKDK